MSDKVKEGKEDKHNVHTEQLLQQKDTLAGSDGQSSVTMSCKPSPGSHCVYCSLWQITGKESVAILQHQVQHRLFPHDVPI